MRPSRRRFLQQMFGAACGIALGDEVLDALDRIAPRPVMVRGADLVSPGRGHVWNVVVVEFAPGRSVYMEDTSSVERYNRHMVYMDAIHDPLLHTEQMARELAASILKDHAR